MKLYKEQTVKTVDSIYCDGCGQSCSIHKSFTDHEYATLEATWGYFSKQDGSQFNIELCETCFNEIIDLLKKKRKQALGPFNYPYQEDPLEGRSYVV